MIKIYPIFAEQIPENEVTFKTWKFPVGEVGVQLTCLDQEIFKADSTFEIYWEFENNEEFFIVANLVDALRNANKNVGLIEIPYLPYSRQDRVCHSGESFALQVFLKMLDSINVKTVITTDLHSQVATKLVNKGSETPDYKMRLADIKQWRIAENLPEFDWYVGPDKGSVSKLKLFTDDGSIKRNSHYLEKTRTPEGIKIVDLTENKLSGKVCIVDDLIDGGGTFLASADVLRKQHPQITELSLYVTHGFFTAGLDKLKEKFDNIYVHKLYNKTVDTSLVKIVL